MFKKTILKIMAIMIFFIPCCSCQADVIKNYEEKQLKTINADSRKQFKDLMKKGEKAYDNDKDKKAVEYYSKAIKINPNSAEAYYQRTGPLASQYYKLEKKDPKSKKLKKLEEKIMNGLTKAITLNPNHYKAYTDRGSSYATMKEFDKALDDYNMAIKINPKHAEAYLWRSWVYKQQKRYDLAKKDLRMVVKLAPFSYGIGAREELKKLEKQGK